MGIVSDLFSENLTVCPYFDFMPIANAVRRCLASASFSSPVLPLSLLRYLLTLIGDPLRASSFALFIRGCCSEGIKSCCSACSAGPIEI